MAFLKIYLIHRHSSEGIFLLLTTGPNLVSERIAQKSNFKNKKSYHKTKYEIFCKVYLDRYFLIIYFKIFQPSDITKYIKIKIIRIPDIIAM